MTWLHDADGALGGRALTWPVCIIGGGPSAAALDLARLQTAALTVAINNCGRALPWADFLFTADSSFLHGRHGRELFEGFHGGTVAALAEGVKPPARLMPKLQVLQLLPGAGVSDDTRSVYSGDNSGFAALNWIVANRNPRIALIGFDLLNGPGPRWWGRYPWRDSHGPPRYEGWAVMFDRVAAAIKARGCDVVNVNPDSGIRGFRFASFESVVTGEAWNG